MASKTHTFTDFYCDERISGHCLLKPSILVGAAYGRVFSPIQQSGCGVLEEVIKRIALVVILPFAAILSAVLIPFGLAVKGMSSPLPEPVQPPGTIYHTPLTSNQSPQQICYPDSSLHNPERVRRNLFGAESGAPVTEDISLQVPCLAEIREEMEEIDRRHIDPNQLAELRRKLEAQSGDADPNELQPLRATLDQLQHHYDYYGIVEADEGEIPVADNGDCIFESSVTLSKLNGSDVSDAKAERAATVAWMRAHYQKDEHLRDYLCNSMAEHFLAKIEMLEADRQGVLQIQGKTKRTEELLEEIEFIQETCTKPLMDKKMDALERYFEEISEEGVFAGQAELYAISCRRKFCIKILSPKKEVEFVFNPQYITEERGARHFIHKRNHYNPYTPPSLVPPK